MRKVLILSAAMAAILTAASLAVSGRGYCTTTEYGWPVGAVVKQCLCSGQENDGKLAAESVGLLLDFGIYFVLSVLVVLGVRASGITVTRVPRKDAP